ncbi:MAG: B12-binding domain-containing radical SAM protein [bacterium]|nr:B12-binding domain-containing radical SAM protein [bacterium]
MIHYDEPLIRPPSEAHSLILQATLGCSHNRCAFCVTYQSKQYRPRPTEELFAEIDWAGSHYREVPRVFLADGDALALKTDRLLAILERLHTKLPGLKRVSCYASPGNFRTKSVADLERLRDAGLGLLYVGFESGDDEVLRRIDKGFTQDEMADLCGKGTQANLKLSATVILGLGGPRLSRQHAEQSARLIDRVRPRFASALTLMLAPRTPSYEQVFDDPEWRLLNPQEMLVELRHLVDCVQADGIIFRSNHASNYLALAGTFQKSKVAMLADIDNALGDSGLLRPEYWRGL